VTALTRREFIVVSASAAGGLVASAYFPTRALGAQPGAAAPAQLGAFVRIEPSGLVVIGARGAEIGQGVITSLPMLIAEELDADWERVRVEQLPLGLEASPAPPGIEPKFGAQGAGGSTNIPEAWSELRQAGAQVRWRLVQAAAQRWGVRAGDVRTERGAVLGPRGLRSHYGELAADAAKLAPPAGELPLKPPSAWRIVGKPQRTVDAAEIVTGRARYGLDVREPGMLVAVIARCPYFGGDVARVDDAKARAIPGVRHVVRLPAPPAGEPVIHNLAAGVAVVADDTWAALKGRDALEIEWKPGPGAQDSTAALEARCVAATKRAGTPLRNDGDVEAALEGAHEKLDVTYVVPFLAHATLEPQNAFVKLAQDRALVISGTQSPGQANKVVHELTGIPRLDIEVRMPRAGGGFGRRGETDAVAEATLIAKQTGAPIKLVWTREDDLRNDMFRPFGAHRLRGALDASGKLTGWWHTTVGTPIAWRSRDMEKAPPSTGLVDEDGVPAGLVPNYRSEFSAAEFQLARGWWRGPVHTFAAFATQSFMDEVAQLAKRDPLEFRLALLGEPRELPYDGHGAKVLDTGRLAQVLRVAGEKIGWGRSLPAGRGLGVAAHLVFGGYAAHAFEVSVERGELRIHRAVCAVDVGQPVNPLGLEAQIMGGTLDGISAALHQEITVKDGRIEQGNFGDYRLLAMREAPRVEVHVVPSTRTPAGAGEMGTPTAAPALANAIFAATGKRLRRMPFAPQLRTEAIAS
jgi:isoquinoline 1-oxidoreductase beta subunit